MGNNCSCKVCVISCIDKYADCKDYINNEGKYNDKKPSEIKINTSINIQNILKTLTVETGMKRTEPVNEPAPIEIPTPTIKSEPVITPIKTETISVPLVKNTPKNMECEFEIL